MSGGANALVAFARNRLRMQLANRGASQADIAAAQEVLDPDALTIGFARRFATYKRATLLLRDIDRLSRIVGSSTRPVQILFGGKAHPRDDGGKALIQEIVRVAERPEFRRRIVFLEDYDMAVARYLVQGCDLWMNTPLRPLEASGTSGMKAMANGLLNVSTLDGWWDEAWRTWGGGIASIGWAIGRGERYDSQDYWDQVEAAALYDLLERDIIPTFYDRGADGLPRRWISQMKASIRKLCPAFNMQRVVREYTTDCYLAAHARYQQLTENDATRTRTLAAWASRVRESWREVRIESVDALSSQVLTARSRMDFRAKVRLGPLDPDDVAVELYLGRLDASNELRDPTAIPMAPAGQAPDGAHLFLAAQVPCRDSGLHGYTVRVLPFHADAPSAFIPGLIRWAEGSAGAVTA